MTSAETKTVLSYTSTPIICPKSMDGDKLIFIFPEQLSRRDDSASDGNTEGSKYRH
jgi:hypothetical protein